MPTKKNRAIYQLKVVLQDIDPPIWRRIQVWDDSTLSQLHRTLQIVMGWEDYHLHEFRIGRRVYSVPDPEDRLYGRKVIDERRVRLRDVASKVGASLVYAYDFGDDWGHALRLDAILLREANRHYPRCIAGERRGPPEDVGGPPGYQYYLEAIADPKHEEHHDKLQWRGPWDPEVFSLAAANRQLLKKFHTTRKTA